MGAVRYLYETRKGLSVKTLFCYDLTVSSARVELRYRLSREGGSVTAAAAIVAVAAIVEWAVHVTLQVPMDWEPVAVDGEVEGFQRMALVDAVALVAQVRARMRSCRAVGEG